MKWDTVTRPRLYEPGVSKGEQHVQVFIGFNIEQPAGVVNISTVFSCFSSKGNDWSLLFKASLAVDIGGAEPGIQKRKIREQEPNDPQSHWLHV